jgi:trimeric autotransporter adhesin
MPNSAWTESGSSISLAATTTTIDTGNVDYLTNSDKITLMAEYASELATKTSLDTTASSLSVSSTYYNNAVAAISTELIAVGAPSDWATTWPDGTTSGPWTGIQTSLSNLWAAIATQRTALQSSISNAQAEAAAEAAQTAAVASAVATATTLANNAETTAYNAAVATAAADATTKANNASTTAIASAVATAQATATALANAAQTNATSVATAAQSTANSALALVPTSVSSLPTLPSTSYPAGKLVMLTTTNALYQVNAAGSAWVSPTTAAANVSGTLTASQIASVNGSAVSGTVASATTATTAGTTSTVGSVSAATVVLATTGQQRNLIPDSDFKFGSTYWTNKSSIAAIVAGAGIDGGRGIVVTGTGSTQNSYLYQSANIPVTAGNSYTLSGYINAASLTSGELNLYLFSAAGAVLGDLLLSYGSSGRVSLTVTIPSGVTTVYVMPSITSAVMASGSTVLFSNIQLEVGSVATAYKSNLIDDTTGSFPGSAITANSVTASQIAAGTITATQLATDSVTATQIAAGAIGVSELAANSVTASALAANSVTAASILAGTITATQLATDSVTATQIAAGAITTDELAANSVTTAKIASASITSDLISAGAVTTNALAAGAVTATTIASGTITATQLAASSVTATQLAAGAVTAASIAADAITADMITTGTLDASEVTVTNLNASNITTGTLSASKVLFADGTALTTASRVSTTLKSQTATATATTTPVLISGLTFSVTAASTSDTFNFFGSLSGGQTVGTVGTECYVNLYVDGVYSQEASVSYATLNGTQSNSFIFSSTGLSAGTHTFTFYLQSSLSSATFQAYVGSRVLLQRIF